MTADRDQLAATIGMFVAAGYVYELTDRILSSSWLVAHDRQVEAQALRKAADHVDRMRMIGNRLPGLNIEAELAEWREWARDLKLPNGDMSLDTATWLRRRAGAVQGGERPTSQDQDIRQEAGADATDEGSVRRACGWCDEAATGAAWSVGSAAVWPSCGAPSHGLAGTFRKSL